MVEHNDKTNNLKYDAQCETDIVNYSYCEYAWMFCSYMLGPNEWMEVEDMAQGLREDPKYAEMIEGKSDSEIDAMAAEIHSFVKKDAQGMMIMAKPCMISDKMVYNDPVTQTEQTCEMDFEFTNMQDMRVAYNGDEIVKVSNGMRNNAHVYTVSIMGEEMYSMDYMLFHSKMYEAGYMMMKEMYYMYKEHELYFNEMMDENYDWNGFVAFLGNWDYYAQKIIDMEKSYIEAEAAKCDVTVKDQRAEYGVYLTDAGERETLKCMDEHIQFYEYIMVNQIDMGEYMCTKFCEWAESMGAEMHQYMVDDADEMTVMPVYPEFVYTPRDSAAMQVAVTEACHAHMNWVLDEHKMYTDSCMASFKAGRDEVVKCVNDIMTKYNDRPAMEAAIDNEFNRVMGYRQYWSCELDLEHMMKNNYDAAVIATRQLECDNLPLA